MYLLYFFTAQKWCDIIALIAHHDMRIFIHFG